MFEKKIITGIRVLPSDKRTFGTEPEFRNFIQNIMLQRGGYYYYPKIGLPLTANTLVLFQYNAKIRAVGIFLESKKCVVKDEQGESYGGYYKFDLETLTYLDNPIDKFTLKDAFPAFNGFSNAKRIITLEYLDKIYDMLERTNGASFQPGRNSAAILAGIEKELGEYNCEGSIREALIRMRVNQGVFRDQLLKKHRRCCLCGISNEELLVASHIKPWCVSTPQEKLDTDNGFLLCPNHDKLFDGGWISFHDDGAIIVSVKLQPRDQLLMNISNDVVIPLTAGNKKYLQYHRKHILKV